MNTAHAAHDPVGGRTAAQNRRLWSMVRRLDQLFGPGQGEAKMREVVKQISGEECTRKLTEAQAEDVIWRLAARLASAEAARRAPEPEELPTRQQLDMIQHFREDLGMATGQLIALTRRIIKKPWPQTRREAGKVYEALSAIFVRKIPREALRARVARLLFLDAELTAWERKFLEDQERRLSGRGRILPGALRKLQEIEGKQKQAAR